ncbi:MAG TPA: LamG-like jellyroll fold domain-containing protein, partial [Polyangiaceae bacterium]
MRTTKLTLLAVLLSGCTSNPYFIGAVGTGATDVDPNLSFAVDLDQSGTSQLGAALELPSGDLPRALVFQGENASAEQWPSAQGSLQRSDTTPVAVQLPAPFTDQTRAVGFVSMAAAFGASSAQLAALAGDDFALELVLKAAPGASIADKRGSAAGWSVAVAADGTVQLALQDDQRLAQVSSEALVTGAWYHCLFWVSRAVGGRAYCNGRESGLTDLSALGSLAGTAPLSLGGGTQTSADRSEIAYFALFIASSGGLGDSTDWARVSRRRFA